MSVVLSCELGSFQLALEIGHLQFGQEVAFPDTLIPLDEQAAQVAIGAEEEIGLLDGGDAGGELERAGHRAALDGVGGLLRFGGGVGIGGQGTAAAKHS